MSNSAFKTQNVTFPAWARRDHPLVARELAALPAFLGKRGRLRNKVLVMALAGLGAAPCLCGCGVIWPLLLVLGILPVIWATPVISRDVAARRWDDLRVTPYTTREIVLAKLSAVGYRMLPLLAFLVSLQVVSMVMSGAMWLVLTGSTVYVATSSGGPQTVDPFASFTSFTGSSPALMILALGLLLTSTILTTALDFLTNIVFGVLASALTSSRGLAVLGVLAARLFLWVGLLGLTLAGLTLLLNDAAWGLILGLMTGVSGSVGWAGLLMPEQFVGVALLVVLLLVAQTAIVLGALALAIWRAERV